MLSTTTSPTDATTPALVTVDANEAVASVAYRANEVIAIYPITPASPMGEACDAWSAQGRANLWGTVPRVVEMQSETGAIATVHGALQTGALATTFTASQGLLLMIPNLYKIAGELSPAVIHVAARTIATHALSIFCDHSDVMAARATGFALLVSNSVQEAQDFALIAQAASLASRIPVLHFFDGFRTSHEIAKIVTLGDDVYRAMIDEQDIDAHRCRALSPDHPVLRGTAQNPDVFFQAREACNPFYTAFPNVAQRLMDQFADATGRRYELFEYHGAEDAQRVVVLMGSGAEAVHETVDFLNAGGEKVGLVKVRLYRPFDTRRFVESLPPTTRSVAILDRTKEPGSSGEPLYLDCVNAIFEHFGLPYCRLLKRPRVIGGRYGLSSKEFTPAMVKGIFDHLNEDRLNNHFTLGINDDVSGTSLSYDPAFSVEADDVMRAVFHGLGSDGTVGANKNTIKIIGEQTDQHVQGYFVYDSKKSGAVTISHLRFGPRPIRSTYLIERANLVACHQPNFLDRYDMFSALLPGGIALLNYPGEANQVWHSLPYQVQQQLVDRRARLYVVDAAKVARESGMGGRINTVMQTCFFALSNVLPRDEAIAAITHAIEKTYRKKGESIVRMNLDAVSRALEHLIEVPVPATSSARPQSSTTETQASPMPNFVSDVLLPIIHRQGDLLPTSKMPVDGTFPTATSCVEKRNLAAEIPVWDPEICIQCGKCAMVCPHATIRSKVYASEQLANAPRTFKSSPTRDRAWQGLRYTIQVAPEDCTGCGICVDVCPVRSKSQASHKAIDMAPQPLLREAESENWNFFLEIPEMDRRVLDSTSIHQQQVQQPLFEFSGACAGCGETPYLKLLTQLFGDRLLIANATGCSSIYGGNLPTTPWAQTRQGKGPAWSNSLFEDNAEFGLGFRIALDKQRELAAESLAALAADVGDDLATAILTSQQRDEAEIHEQRQRIQLLRQRITDLDTPAARRLAGLADMLVKKSVWIVGGDGWAYDIGFGGLDQVLASGHDVNILVLDTEVYSNTGGQASKATPRGAVAKFASGGKPNLKKDLGLIAMTYRNVYVAQVALGARDEQTLRAFLEAEAYRGPSLIIAYSHCIAHGIDMTKGMQNQKAAVDSSQWLLYRYHPDRIAQGENPLRLDSRPPKIAVADYMQRESRFQMLHLTDPEAARRLTGEAQRDADLRRQLYEYLAAMPSATSARADAGTDKRPSSTVLAAHAAARRRLNENQSPR